MKILMISNMYPSSRAPHYGVFVRNMIESLEKTGIKIDKIVCYKQFTKIEKVASYLMFYLRVIFRGLFKKYDFIYAHYASHTALPLLILLKIKPKLKIIINVHGNDVVPEEDKDKKFIPLVKKILKKSYYIVAPSYYFKHILMNEYEIDEKYIFVSPSGGVNLNVFYKKNNNRGDIFTVGFVSRIEKNKGWDVFLEAANKLLSENWDIRFVMVGQGSEEEMKELMKRYNLEETNRFEWKPFLSQTELADIYNNLDVFCFPTRRQSESLGLVGLEAMSCGAIIIGSNKYGPSSYINDGVNGLSFDPINVDELKEKIVSLYNMPLEKRRKMSYEAMKTVKSTYDSKIVEKKLEKFLKYCTNRK